MQAVVFVHNATHTNMYFVISVNVNSCCKQMNALVLKVAHGHHLLEQLLVIVHLQHVLLLQINKHVLKFKDVIGTLMHNHLAANLLLLAVVLQVKMHKYVIHNQFIVQDQMELIVNHNNN